jgi:hypothetical protein
MSKFGKRSRPNFFGEVYILRGARIKWVRNISLVRKIRKQKLVDFVCFYRYMIKETYYINKD